MGIIDGTPTALIGPEKDALVLEASTIFSSVFIGFLDSAFQKNVPLRWDVEPDSSPDRQERALGELSAAVIPLAEHVSRTRHRGQVDIGVSQAHDRDHVAISTSEEIDRRFEERQELQPRSEWVRRYMRDLAYPADSREPAPKGYREWATGLDELREENLDKEFGAYYGIVDHPDNVPPRVISSVRCLIPYGGEPARWNRGVALHGLIGYEQEDARPSESPKQAGSFEPTGMIREWAARGGGECVCGYCHGMVWAVGMARTDFPGGIPYEIALGEKTLKLASCFGCTTFLYANGIAPASMHLGRSESWIPLPEDDYGLGGLAYFSDEEAARVVVRQLNGAWEDSVAGWLRTGAEIIAANQSVDGKAPLFSGAAAGIASKLLDEARRRDNAAAAALFLDALTVHEKKDVDRLRAIRA